MTAVGSGIISDQDPKTVTVNRLVGSEVAMKRRFALGCLFTLLIGAPAATITQEVGPANGSLVVVGGGRLSSEIVDRFLRLAGVYDAPIVVIPTAGGGEHYDQYYAGLRGFKAAGATNLTVLHTTDPAVANTATFVQPILEARGVWFSGGRQWRLVDAYFGTKVHDELWALLDRGGVIGGSSAGATIQGSYLARGDTATNTIMMGDHEAGLGFLRNVVIDQHLLRRNRQFDLLEVIEAHPELLGIGLDENTAIVVQGDEFEVIGASYAVIYDAERQLDSGGRFYFLAPGDHYNLKTREPTRPIQSEAPIDRVVEKPWTPR